MVWQYKPRTFKTFVIYLPMCFGHVLGSQRLQHHTACRLCTHFTLNAIHCLFCPSQQKTSVSDKTEFRRPFMRDSKTKLTEFYQNIMCYRGELPQPQWLDVDSGQFLPFSVCPSISSYHNRYVQKHVRYHSRRFRYEATSTTQNRWDRRKVLSRELWCDSVVRIDRVAGTGGLERRCTSSL